MLIWLDRDGCCRSLAVKNVKTGGLPSQVRLCCYRIYLEVAIEPQDYAVPSILLIQVPQRAVAIVIDISPRALAHVFITSLPVLIVTVTLSAFDRSSNGEHQDLLTELISLLARPILGKPAALLKSQRAFNRDYGVRGRIWVSRWTVPVDSERVNENEMGETDECFNRDQGQCRPITLRQAVWLAILDLGKGDAEGEKVQAACFAKNEMPVVHPVEVEWTAYRRNAFPLSPRPALSERQMYMAMMEDIGTRGPTILYFHGGAHCLMDPVTHRWPTSTLAKESGGSRAVSPI
ncbi:hypothetical protein LTR20_006023 [Exophiala xenobiotica]|nr:hypothetical protein LTS13_003008 [Exophiala xenobiotica]KAK5396003.1 hypothetical protein LTR79_006757 [Exophiala xenobiotica]KAK5423956.1 hypothetical protein LTR90_001302 [Exophiala xenobiotica]KAK5462074.1 hypothetical protein LTR20_006023 [Exophiala xenobiotica]KAK5479758.1 hypothetical protein LTR26_007611 [Exophiala xenobiotica]